MRPVLMKRLACLLVLFAAFAGASSAQTEGVYGSADGSRIEGVSDNGNGTFHIFLMDGDGLVLAENDVGAGLVSAFLEGTLDTGYTLLSTAGDLSFMSFEMEPDIISGPAESVVIGYGIVTDSSGTWFVGHIGDLSVGDFDSTHAEDNAGDFVAGVNTFLEQDGTMTFGSVVNLSNMLNDLLDTFDSVELEYEIGDCVDLLEFWLNP